MDEDMNIHAMEQRDYSIPVGIPIECGESVIAPHLGMLRMKIDYIHYTIDEYRTTTVVSTR
jgi:hypothetical protein